MAGHWACSHTTAHLLRPPLLVVDERTTAKTLVYMDLSKVIHLVPSPRYEQNTFMVSRMGPRHTGHIGVLVLVSCSAHASHTHW